MYARQKALYWICLTSCPTIGIPKGEQTVYPVWQFQGNHVVPKLDQVLALLVDSDSISQCVFMLTPIAMGEVNKILKHGLANEVEILMRRAKQAGVQGAV
ncbi:MAG: hypothetical protein OQL06_12840 [Gammaproteobacteria bacterium]|nr:hypothetical protein [Gammaproteobacteria bacterium]